jgi:hypothetical protein
MKLKIFLLLQFCSGSLTILKKLLLNFKKIKNADNIFINSQGFGHSVSDSILFIEKYGHGSLVISLGTEFNQKPGTERNRFFDMCLEKNLIGIYLPSMFLRKHNWKYMHPLTKIFLKIFCIFFHKNEYTIHENNQKLAENIMPNIITKNFNNNLSNAKLIVDSITKSLVAVENHHHAAGYLPFLIKSPSIDTSSLYRGLNGRSLKIIQSRLLGEDFVCLAIRRGDAPYHSKADYYFDAVDLINSMGFKVTLIGDRKYFFDLAKEKNYSFESKINNIDLTIREQKLFELFAIQNCKFIFGDQGGVWSLVSAFNRPGLMVNATPSSQLQYNVESLPRRWIYKSTGAEMLDVNKIFGELFFRWKDESKVSTLFENQSNKNIELGKDDYLINVENDKEFIIEVLERYMKDAAYLIPNKMQESVKANFPENNFLRLAENSSYSKEYINKLVGWATK